MGIPGRYRNMKRDRRKPPTRTMVGLVVDVDSDQRHASVEVSGNTWRCTVPGSILGLAEGQSVAVSTEGNVRRVESRLTVIPKETYNVTNRGKRSVDTWLAGSGGGASSPSYIGQIGIIGHSIPGFSVSDASSNSVGEVNKSRLYIRRLVTRFTNDTNSNFSAIANVIRGLSSDVRGLRGTVSSATSGVRSNGESINELRQNMEEMRDLYETLVDDLREQGLVE